MTESKKQEFDSYEEPLLVRVEPSEEDDSSTNNPSSPSKTPNNAATETSKDTPLASDRQITGAMWAGGITGLLVCGPLGALLGAWAGHFLAKNKRGPGGKLARKAGDFTTRMGATIQREWNKSTSDSPTTNNTK